MVKVLWVDDNLLDDLTELRMSLLMEDDFDVHFAENASEALDHLRSNVYDTIILDLLLPPGKDAFWEPERKKNVRKYGVALLHAIFGDRRANILPENHTISKYCVLTIEGKVENNDLFEKPIFLHQDNFKPKVEVQLEEELIKFIWNVHHKNNGA